MTEQRQKLPFSLIFKVLITITLFVVVVRQIPLKDAVYVFDASASSHVLGSVLDVNSGAVTYRPSQSPAGTKVTAYLNRPVREELEDGSIRWWWIVRVPEAGTPLEVRPLKREEGTLTSGLRPRPEAAEVSLTRPSGDIRVWPADQIAGGATLGVEPGFPTLLRSLHIGWFLCAFFMFVPSHVLPAIRWRILIMARGIQITSWMAIKLVYLGIFFSQFMPSTVGGDVIRAWYVARNNEKDRSTAALSVFIDRVVGLFGILMIGSVAVLLQHDNPAIRLYGGRMALFVGLLVVGSCIYFSRSLRGLFAVDRILSLLPLGRRLRDVEAKIFAYRDHKAAIFKAFLLTVAIQANFIVVNFILAMSLGLKDPWSQLGDIFVILPIVTVLVAIPISVGGFGFREYLFVHFFTMFGLDAGVGFATSLLQGVVTMIWSLLGGIAFLSLRKQVPADPL